MNMRGETLDQMLAEILAPFGTLGHRLLTRAARKNCITAVLC
jgi:hypothetical protein